MHGGWGPSVAGTKWFILLDEDHNSNGRGRALEQAFSESGTRGLLGLIQKCCSRWGSGVVLESTHLRKGIFESGKSLCLKGQHHLMTHSVTGGNELRGHVKLLIHFTWESRWCWMILKKMEIALMWSSVFAYTVMCRRKIDLTYVC